MTMYEDEYEPPAPRRNPVLTVAIAVMVIVVVTIGAAIWTMNRDKKHDWPASTISNFMTACQATSNGNTGYCKCAVDKLQAKLSAQEFSRLEAGVAFNGTFPKQVTDIAGDCALENS